jgi:hypothetical protein
MKHPYSLAVVALIAGCAMSSGVLKTGPDTYTITVSEETGHDFPAAGRTSITFRCLPKDDPALTSSPH